MNLFFFLPYRIGPVETAIRTRFRDGVQTCVVDESHALPSLSILPFGWEYSEFDDPLALVQYAIVGSLQLLGLQAREMPESTQFFIAAAMTVRLSGVSEPVMCRTADKLSDAFDGTRRGGYVEYRLAVQTVRSSDSGVAAPLIVPGRERVPKDASIPQPVTDLTASDPIGVFLSLFPGERDRIVREVGTYLSETCTAFSN